MEYTLTAILHVLENALVEKAVSKVKKDFAADREMRSLRIQTVLKAIEGSFEEKATNKSLAKIRSVAGLALLDRGMAVSPDNVLGLGIKGGFLGIFAGIGKYLENTLDEDDYAKIVENMNLTATSKAILMLGGSIGQIFINQPDLFV